MVPNYYISKRAAEESSIDKIISTMINPNKGLFENLFRFAPYVAPFFGIPWWQVIATAVGTHALGINPASLGKKLDDALGTGPGQTIPTMSILLDNLQSYLTSLLEGAKFKEADLDYILVKEAGIWSTLFKGTKLIPGFVKTIAKLLGGLLAFYGVATIDDWIRKATSGIREHVPDVLNTGRNKELAPEGPSAPISKREPMQDKVENMVEQLREKYHLNKE